MNPANVILTSMLLALAVFQLILALGAPYGKAAWGGKHTLLPTGLRLASAASSIFFLFISALVWVYPSGLGPLSPYAIDLILQFMLAYFALGVVLNAISRSRVERLWAPYILVMAVLLYTITI
jgi:hypothetical protein